ncbi:TetR/AcrR family transcriptional regulator [Schaedlerella sp.]|jgi:AcrR family transcriptional regulator|uniref:TetR/AcrR family transcriptional regulator n=1 Tax=Schaedlerella sp. TaxID=2676057 RepID=UPI0013621F88|nr:TetR/AcrR family transcriptional regulator [uncultured Schaedlerella sp.]MCI8766974.1 TetR/AcrR family transcriptional regulator [Ruminococcus sp.]NBJ01093.1 TetR/AcrR family transcriptional regulator [Lachnospiraceae bacterium]
MHNNKKSDLILDSMQKLMLKKDTRSISVSEIAREAGIGKGSIYYYFKSKEEIVDAVIERSYSDAIRQAQELVQAPGLDALTKMEIIFRTCRDSSIELSRQEAGSYMELQQSALLHQQYIYIMIRNLRPILADIIRQGNQEGTISCSSPDEVAEIVLIILTIKFDTYLSNSDLTQTQKTLDVFTYMLETSFQIEKGRLDYIWSE